ncbi:MAG: DNA alkylation repair protein [Bacteroides sp.]|nr:DNA alkylation repair protein [Prevotella sp.]MCM1407303.1 DNA alkylation repair protein [Treponema brennaborense]MCM1469793.1 DNA alkylation repair protein [Bacteroides sp.]
MDIENAVRKQLFCMQDLPYKDFQCRLMPTISPDTVIGIRMPNLRKFSAEFSKQPEASLFLKCLPHQYFEENNLHGLLISAMSDYEMCSAALDEFLPHIDNWATCDLLSPRSMKKYPPQLLPDIRRWLGSTHAYTIRFAVGMLLKFFLDKHFSPEFLAMAAAVSSDEYYVKMMIAWYFSAAIAKQYDAAIVYLEQNRLDIWTHNKAIQKSLESFRVSSEQKTYLRSLKR